MQTRFNQHKMSLIRKMIVAKSNAFEKRERQEKLKRQDAYSDETHQDFKISIIYLMNQTGVMRNDYKS